MFIIELFIGVDISAGINWCNLDASLVPILELFLDINIAPGINWFNLDQLLIFTIDVFVCICIGAGISWCILNLSLIFSIEMYIGGWYSCSDSIYWVRNWTIAALDFGRVWNDDYVSIIDICGEKFAFSCSTVSGNMYNLESAGILFRDLNIPVSGVIIVMYFGLGDVGAIACAISITTTFTAIVTFTSIIIGWLLTWFHNNNLLCASGDGVLSQHQRFIFCHKCNQYYT